MARVLIVEDEENIARMIEATLTLGGHTSQWCADGTGALPAAVQRAGLQCLTVFYKFDTFSWLLRAPFCRKIGSIPELPAKGGLFMRSTMTMETALPAGPERRPGRRARRGSRRRDLLKMAAALAAWVTLGYAEPQRSEFFWLLEDGTAYYPYRNLHCVVLAGAEDGKYRAAGPRAAS